MPDRVLLGGALVDPLYPARGDGLFVVVVDCTEPGGTCFCVSTGTGPAAAEGFDVALVELIDARGHRFVARAAADAGADVLGALGTAADDDLATARALVERAAGRMGGTLETADVRELLYATAAHPHWEDVARRRPACTNRAIVCPTCFRTAVDDRPSLDMSSFDRTRTWDPCFTVRFSYAHGGPVRSSVASRYRQWLTHELASSQDQFGSLGCVGSSTAGSGSSRTRCTSTCSTPPTSSATTAPSTWPPTTATSFDGDCS